MQHTAQPCPAPHSPPVDSAAACTPGPAAAAGCAVLFFDCSFRPLVGLHADGAAGIAAPPPAAARLSYHPYREELARIFMTLFRVCVKHRKIGWPAGKAQQAAAQTTAGCASAITAPLAHWHTWGLQPLMSHINRSAQLKQQKAMVPIKAVLVGSVSQSSRE